MKRRLKRDRHCERSKAIQLTMHGLPRSLRFLAMTFLVLTISYPAFACMEISTIQSHVRKAEVIFEGHLIRFEKGEIVGKDKRVRSRLIKVLAVDKNWKGTKENEEIKIQTWNSSVEDGGELPALPEDSAKGIFVLYDKVSDGANVIYSAPGCPFEMQAAQRGDMEETQQILQNKIKFWPFWAFYSVKRTFQGLL